MSTKELTKSRSAPRDIGHLGSGDQDEGQHHGEHLSGSNPHPNHDSDIFSFLSAMNSGGFMGGPIHPAAVHVLASRKRKFLDQGNGTQFNNGSGKLFGGVKYPILRRGSDDDHPLHTPQCSQSGYADDEDRRNHQREQEEGNNSGSNKNRTSSPGGHQTNLISDIDENLASDFDGSLSGLGVDINTSTYSMSEALMALPNLTISSGHMFKQEVPSPPTQSRNTISQQQQQHSGGGNHLNNNRMSSNSPLKEEPVSNNSNTANSYGSKPDGKSNNRSPPLQNFGALDLSSDEAAHFPDSEESEEAVILGPKTFTGSVSRGGTPTVTFHPLTTSNSHQHLSQISQHTAGSLSSSFGAVNLSASHPNLTTIGSMNREENANNNSSPAFGMDGDNLSRYHKVILPLQNSSTPRKTSQEQMITGSSSSSMASDTGNSSAFQYILNASTSIATKVSDPSITYLNQGQAYEITLKKMGDLTSQRKRLLKCQMRICFHERRLQYMELEQISEWSIKHPAERILDLDLPLSYGIVDPVRDPCNLNVVSFKWDPSRDTGVYVKVNCISTEFTPKKHGGEKGVPFRLQVETFDLDDNRLHAAGCILQVFKLKGADRKHKQDRDKILKRPSSEQEKYSRPFECTFLTPIPPESLYNPSNSRSTSPENIPGDASMSQGRHNSREEGLGSSGMFFLGSSHQFDKDSMSSGQQPMPAAGSSSSSMNIPVNTLAASATIENVIQWLSRNRYGSLLPNFRNYNGRDLLRLSREDVIAMCGMCDGIRLYNDLHLVSIAPRSTFYVALKDTNEYDALFLEELTVAELVKRLAICVGLQESIFGGIFKKNHLGCHVRVTDAVVQFVNPESVFYFTLRHNDNDKCDVILEDATPNNSGHLNTDNDSKGMESSSN